ncbi:hypothetical protein Agub_g7646 [Astrephomene gubernaculifera]|uniref:EF-hand domain-containing protein n=1 Tax=Astrephomene gubernaculifera TaxID=47775 RepID=A0AAD3HMH9_9CHLO|nr:hypothetical protein Agub_g7646 [Astrephomene gubernaculifera]
MVFHATSTRVLFLGFTAFVAISMYILVITHHVKLPQVEYSAHSRDKVAMEALHHVLLEDFAKYDTDGDSKLSVQEFSAMLHESNNQLKQLQQQQAESLHGAIMAAVKQEQQQRPGVDGQKQQEGISIRTNDGEYDDVEESYGGGDLDGDYVAEDEKTTVATGANKQQQQQPKQEQQKQQVQGQQQQAAVAPSPSPQAAAAVTSGSSSTGTSSNGTATATSSSNSTPGGGCPHLSREHVAQFARNNTIMLTVADWRIFGTMGINWMKHLAKWGVDYYLVGATDAKTSQFLGHTGKHPCFKFYEEGASQGSDEYRYGDSHYNAATWRKVVVVSRMVHWGFNVIHSDVDVVWFRDPLPYFLGPKLANVDMAVSSDLISTQNPPGDDGLEVGMHQHTNFNTGVYFVKSTPGGKSFMAGWAAMRGTNINENDQVGVYSFIRNRPAFPEQRVLVLRHNTGEMEAARQFAADPDKFVRVRKEDPLPVATEMRLGALGVHMLLNGYSYFIPKLHESMNITPLGIHMTWVPLSKEGKFHRFRDGMLYDDPPEYYDSPDTKYLTADIEAPDAPSGYNTWRETEDMIQVHLKNMPPQLRQVYRAIAAALALNRTLIFPRLRCYCFKNWFMSEQCRIPGDKVTKFPLDCALDQVFRPKVLYNYPPLQTRNGLQNFTFREYSLLDNPRTPPAVRNGQVLVVPEGADAGNTTGFVGVVRVRPGLMQDELLKALEEVKDAKVIRLRRPIDIFGGFSDEILAASVSQFAEKVTANWCCRDEPYIKKGMDRKVKMRMDW